ncbi:hypothetical protein GALL_279940 [mine drainage metagenome]|uniref:Uncharacterized protein n=1 Tax=mine drainage metagenome TaxID=410659 RepID=A0A1J5RD96_9ZZZZ
MSLMNRTVLAILLLKPYSASQVPAMSPIGTPMAKEMQSRNRLPTKAFRKP